VFYTDLVELKLPAVFTIYICLERFYTDLVELKLKPNSSINSFAFSFIPT